MRISTPAILILPRCAELAILQTSAPDCHVYVTNAHIMVTVGNWRMARTWKSTVSLFMGVNRNGDRLE